MNRFLLLLFPLSFKEERVRANTCNRFRFGGRWVDECVLWLSLALQKPERAKISEAWFSPANLVDVVGRGREDVLGLFHERVGHLDALVQRLRLALPAALGLLPVGGFDCGRKKIVSAKKKIPLFQF
jgi:hypothetical protein